MRRRVLLLALATAASGLLSPGRAWACSCATVTRAEAIESSAVVFAGTLAGERATGGDEITYLFEVDTVVKGDVPERVLMTNVVQEGNSCAHRLRPHKRYLVFGDDPDKLSHHMCSPTTVIGNEDVAGTVPVPGGESLPPDGRWFAWSAVAVGAVAVLLLRRRLRDPSKRRA